LWMVGGDEVEKVSERASGRAKVSTATQID